jgi:hypothetical protein
MHVEITKQNENNRECMNINKQTTPQCALVGKGCVEIYQSAKNEGVYENEAGVIRKLPKITMIYQNTCWVSMENHHVIENGNTHDMMMEKYSSSI